MRSARRSRLWWFWWPLCKMFGHDLFYEATGTCFMCGTDDRIECLDCGDVFIRYPGYPKMRCCMLCVPLPKQMPEYRCPCCGWDSTRDDVGDNLLRSRHHQPAIAYVGAESWVEDWKCPECKKEFSYANGSD